MSELGLRLVMFWRGKPFNILQKYFKSHRNPSPLQRAGIDVGFPHSRFARPLAVVFVAHGPAEEFAMQTGRLASLHCLSIFARHPGLADLYAVEWRPEEF